MLTLLSGVAIRHADRMPCLCLPSVAPHLSTEEAERGLREEASLTEKIVRW